jgi:hypothetical protein
MRQHTTPYIVPSDNSKFPRKLLNLRETGKTTFNEDRLQQFIFQYPDVLPIDEVEPVFGSLIPVCRELETNVGMLDNLFVNSAGMLTLVECKLWRNPQARREVVGQILDYAQQLSRWSYSDLEDAIRKTTRNQVKSLYELVKQESEEIDEQEFIDNVSRNLKRGRFLLLIVGDGIRESVEQIANFLQNYANLSFSFALIEVAVFSLDKAAEGDLFVQSRVISRTVEIERTVVQIEDSRGNSGTPIGAKPPAKNPISQKVFFEELSQSDSNCARKLSDFLERAKNNLDLIIVPGSSSLSLKTSDERFNFAVFYKNGNVSFAEFWSRYTRLDYPEIGERYLRKIAALFPGAILFGTKDQYLQVKKNQRWLKIAEVLEVQNQFLDLISETIHEIREAMD